MTGEVLVGRKWVVNGNLVNIELPPLRRLIDILREDLELTGTKEGCGEGECGACTVVVDGEAVCSCLLTAAQLSDGSRILTVEGLEALPEGRVLQQAFLETGAVQCGFCIPGMLLSAYAFLSSLPAPAINAPSESEIRKALAGNICRCTGYVKIVEAVGLAARRWPSPSRAAGKPEKPAGNGTAVGTNGGRV